MGATVSRGDNRLNACTINHALTTLYFFCCMQVLTPALLPCLDKRVRIITSLLRPPSCRVTNLGVGCPAIPPAPEHTREGQWVFPFPEPSYFPLLLILMDTSHSSLRGFSVPLSLAVVPNSMLSCQQPCSVPFFDLRTRP